MCVQTLSHTYLLLVLEQNKEKRKTKKILFKQFLSENTDIFAQSSTDMLGINPEIICHKLSIRADAKPVKHKLRRMNKERSRVIRDEVDHLLQAGFIRGTIYPDWLSNPILVKKKNENWRDCIDFTNLNKIYPKDSYPLLRIDQLVEATMGHELLSFVDAYSDYN